METATRFGAYAAAFEESVQDDDWSRLQAFFTPDAVYAVNGGPPLGGRAEGRDAVVAKLRGGVVDLDRRYDVRRTELVGQPEIGESTFTLRWRATYEKQGCPDLVIEGDEIATFAGDLIQHLEDRVDEGTDALIAEHMQRYLDGSPR